MYISKLKTKLQARDPNTINNSKGCLLSVRLGVRRNLGALVMEIDIGRLYTWNSTKNNAIPHGALILQYKFKKY